LAERPRRSAVIEPVRLGLCAPSAVQLAEQIRKLADGGTAMIVIRDFLTAAMMKDICWIAADARIAVIGEHARIARAGALFSYGTDLTDLFRRATGYVDNILKGWEAGGDATPLLGMIRSRQGSDLTFYYACMTVSRSLSAYGCACLCPADSEGQDAMQQVGVVKPVMPGGCSELLAFRYFGIGVRFDEIRSAIGSEAKVDACVSIELQCAVDAFIWFCRAPWPPMLPNCNSQTGRTRSRLLPSTATYSSRPSMYCSAMAAVPSRS